MAGSHEDGSEQRGGLVAGDELGGEQGVPERERAGVEGYDCGVSAGAVAEDNRDAVADAGVRRGGALAAERDRVAVQRGEGTGAHPDVESPALSSLEDLGRESVIGGAEARPERSGSQGDRRAYARDRAGVAERRGRQSRAAARYGQFTRQGGVLLLGDGVVDGGGAEQQGAAQGDREHDGRGGR